MSEYVLKCPFCDTEQVVTGSGRQVTLCDLAKENAEGPRRLVVKFVVCPNPRCREFSLSASLHTLETHGRRSYTGKQLATWDLVPPSRARTFPVAVPVPVLDDYHEACLTVERSPKAAAALARRCLSSMLRDFWRVQPGSLSDEFRQVKGTVDPLTWEAIESVRSTGLIGTRMESEGAEVLDTEPGEATLLIGLIETLIQDWYVGREARRKRLVEIKQIAGEGGIRTEDAAV
jgi:hypothetical protein